MLLSRQQYKFVLSIPIINIIADSIQNYFQSSFVSPGYLRAMIIIGFILIHFKDFYRKSAINNLILFSLIYYFILSLFSSDFIYTQKVYFVFLIACLMFPIGYYYFSELDKLKKLLRIMSWILGISIIFLVISNLFGLGSSDYLEGLFFGAGTVNITKAMMILILMYPIIIRFENNKKLRILHTIILIVAIIFVLIGIKRSAILGLFVGYFAYFFLTPYKTGFTKALFVVSIILFLTSPLYFDTMAQRVEARRVEGAFNLSQAEEEEARAIEIRKVLIAFDEGNLSYKLFGAELFNSMAYFKTKRMLHTDYATMFAGAGIIGFIFFILIYYLIFKRSYFFYKVFKRDPEKRDIMAVSISMGIALMITGISGTVTEISLRAIPFMFWGASFSFLNQEMKNSLLKRSY